MKRLYARVSTQTQDLENQVEILTRNLAPGEYELYIEKISGKDRNRPELKRLLRETGIGDEVRTTKLDRLARSERDLLNIIEEIEQKGAKFMSLGDPGMDTSIPSGRFLLQILGAVAELERSMINRRMKEGREFARSKGVKFGRPALKTGKKNGEKYISAQQVMRMHHEGMSANRIRKEIGCSINPVLRIIKASYPND